MGLGAVAAGWGPNLGGGAPLTLRRSTVKKSATIATGRKVRRDWKLPPLLAASSLPLPLLLWPCLAEGGDWGRVGDARASAQPRECRASRQSGKVHLPGPTLGRCLWSMRSSTEVGLSFFCPLVALLSASLARPCHCSARAA